MLASIYALIACGYVMIYRVSRVRIWQLQRLIGYGESFDNFQKPIDFPHDKQEPSKNRKHEPIIFTGLIDHVHPISASHPSSLVQIKMVMFYKFADFPEPQLSLSSAR